ncbi:MAG: glycosyltransferase family 2 protein [Pseudomonadota bacterium]
MEIAVAITCFNRKSQTLRCLNNLKSSCPDAINLRIHLTDDGSSDGTSEAVRAQFPDVHILSGDGTLFWSGGMRKAIESAMQTEFDFLLWLNDDVELFPNALYETYQAIKKASHEDTSILVGATLDKEDGSVTYSGLRYRHKVRKLKFERVDPRIDQQNLLCDTLNGNYVVLPRCVCEQVGNISCAVKHAMGDIEYGFRAHREGFEIRLLPNPVGICVISPIDSAIKMRQRTFKQQIQHLASPKILPPKDWWYMTSRYGGYLWIVSFVIPYIKGIWQWIAIRGKSNR